MQTSQNSATGSAESLSRLSTLSPDQLIALARSFPGAKLTLEERVRLVLMFGRPRTCIVGILTFVLGAHYASLPWTAKTVTGAVLGGIGSFLANLHNTCTDLEEDSRNVPGRVHLVIRFGLRRLQLVVASVYLAMCAAAAWIGPACLAFMAVGLFLVHQYSSPPYYAKRRPWMGLLVFAQVAAYPFLSAVSIEEHSQIRSELLSLDWSAMAPPTRHMLSMMLFLSIWFYAKGLVKNLADYYGDKAAGVSTSATVWSTYQKAAAVALTGTILAYLTLLPVALGGAAPLRVLWALLWLGPVAWNAVRMGRAQTPAAANAALHTDMLLSVAFMMTTVAFVSPKFATAVATLAGAAIIVLADRLKIDTRRSEDTASAVASSG